MNFNFLKKIKLVFITFAFSACHLDSHNLPIQKDKLIPVLIDIHMVDPAGDHHSFVCIALPQPVEAKKTCRIKE